MGQRADGLDRVLDAGFDDAVAGIELVAAAVHVVAEQARVDARGDLCRAGGLGAVADDAGGDGHSVDQRMLDLLIPAAIEVGDARPRAAPGRDRAAVGRKRPDVRLDMDRAEIGDRQRPVERLAAHAQLLRVDDDRYGRRDALVAGAGIDDDRQLAPGHARVAGRGSHIAGAVLHRLTVGLAQRFADVRAVGAIQTRFGDGHVVRDLPLKDLLHVLRTEHIGKVHDALDGQDAPVGAALRDGLAARTVDDACRAVEQLHEIRVIADDARGGMIAVRIDSNTDIEDEWRIDGADIKFGGLEIRAHVRDLRVRDLAQDLQLLVLAPGDDTGGSRRRNAVHGACVRHDDAFDVLDDISADLDLHPRRTRAERRTRLRGRVGNGDRLRAAHGGNQLLTQDVQKALI